MDKNNDFYFRSNNNKTSIRSYNYTKNKVHKT